MTAQLIDGTALAAQVRAQVAERVHALRGRGMQPGLAVILVGDDPASAVYVRNKVRPAKTPACARCSSSTPPTLTEARPAGAHRARSTPTTAIHGILVQMPLPKHIDPQQVIEAIAPAQGRRRLLGRQRRRADGRACPASGLHALRLHEADREHRRAAARQACRGDRPQQHRRQADGADAAAGQRHRHHLPQRAPPTWPRTRGRPTSWSPRSAGATR